MKTQENNTPLTQTSSQMQIVTFQHQLLDDLYFSYVSQKEMDEIHEVGAQGSMGCCGSHITIDGDLIFFIFVKRDLDLDIFLKVFCDEFHHYCINKIIYKWLDPQFTGKIPPLTAFVSEMLSHEACWDCKHLGSIKCWKHPNNPIQKVHIRAFLESLGDEALFKLSKEIIRTSKDCLFVKMYDFDGFAQRLSIRIISVLTFLHRLLARIIKKAQKGYSSAEHMPS